MAVAMTAAMTVAMTAAMTVAMTAAMTVAITAAMTVAMTAAMTVAITVAMTVAITVAMTAAMTVAITVARCRQRTSVDTYVSSYESWRYPSSVDLVEFSFLNGAAHGVISIYETVFAVDLMALPEMISINGILSESWDSEKQSLTCRGESIFSLGPNLKTKVLKSNSTTSPKLRWTQIGNE
jgi:hypothetical protein